MTTKLILRALLAGSILASATGARAQDAQPDPSDATADAAIAAAGQPDEAAAKLELLQAQVEALQEQLEAMKTAMVKATPAWKGGPEMADKDSGFSFKPKGFVQFDAGYVGYPEGVSAQPNPTAADALNYANLGFNTRARRLVLGAEGGLPGGFKYKAEFNFAQGQVDYEDVLLSYDFKKAPLTVTIGNFYPFSSLETMTSSRLGSMLERASFTDAFGYNRRIGVALGVADKVNDRYTLSAGLFGATINDATNFTRTGWEASARATYSPKLGQDGLLHLGASVHHRVNNREQQVARYRSRPLTQITDQRLVDTKDIASTGDDSVGVELGAIYKSLHVAAEAQKLWVRGYRPGELVDGGPNSALSGTRYNGDPSFTGGYVELGYYLTGESRGYKGGKWDRTKVKKPFNDGGWGALQVNGRLDYLDLRDRVDSSSPSYGAPFYVNGGKQVGYQLSLIWNPIDYVRFLAQYGHVEVTSGPRVGGVYRAGDPTPVNDRKFGVDTAAVRAQLEF